MGREGGGPWPRAISRHFSSGLKVAAALPCRAHLCRHICISGRDRDAAKRNTETVKFVSTGKRKRLNTTRYIGHPPVVLSRLRQEVFHLRHAGRNTVYALTRVRHHLSSPVARASTRIYALLCTVSVWIGVDGQECR